MPPSWIVRIGYLTSRGLFPRTAGYSSPGPEVLLLCVKNRYMSLPGRLIPCLEEGGNAHMKRSGILVGKFGLNRQRKAIWA